MTQPLSSQTDPSRLRTLRRARGLTQEAVARIVGVTASQVSKWEHPTGPVPQPRNLRRLARLYRVSVDELSRPAAE
jgi:transcriptional regulator with XRE-family HTH domain